MFVERQINISILFRHYYVNVALVINEDGV